MGTRVLLLVPRSKLTRTRRCIRFGSAVLLVRHSDALLSSLVHVHVRRITIPALRMYLPIPTWRGLSKRQTTTRKPFSPSVLHRCARADDTCDRKNRMPIFDDPASAARRGSLTSALSMARLFFPTYTYMCMRIRNIHVRFCASALFVFPPKEHGAWSFCGREVEVFF